MANIKLKDLLNEMTIAGGIVSESPWTKNEQEKPSVNVKELIETIRNFHSIGESIYGKGSLKEVAKSLSSIAEGAAQHTLSEVDDMFDKVTVSRNMKELTNLSKQFGKVANEANSLQERMSGLYEDMGHVLGRYFEIEGDEDKDDLRKIGLGKPREKDLPTGDERDDAPEGHNIDEGDYQDFFAKAMKKFGIKSPAELDDEGKKKFFNYVDKNFQAKTEGKK